MDTNVNRRVCLLVTLLLFCITELFAQNFPYKRFGVEDGLPSNTVYDIYRDKRGVLWIGTNKGIATYNGIKFEVYSMVNGLPDKEVFFFTEDLAGRLWLATFNGELCYYKDGIFHSAANNPLLKLPTKYDHIRYINREEDSSVSICYAGTPNFVNVGLHRVKQICLLNDYNLAYLEQQGVNKTANARYALSSIIFVHKATDTTYSVYTEGCNFDIDTNGRIIHLGVYHPKLYFPIGDKPAQIDSLGIYYRGTSYHFRKKTNDVWIDKKGSNVLRLYYDSVNHFISLRNGLRIADSGIIFNKANISSITQDNTGNYWLASLDTGIFCFSANFSKQHLVSNAYVGNVVFSTTKKHTPFFADDRNNLFCLRQQKVEQLFRFDEKGSLIEPYKMQQGHFLTEDLEFFFNYDNRLYRVLCDTQGKAKKLRLSTTDNLGIKDIFASRQCLIVQNRNAILNIPLSLFGRRTYRYQDYVVSDSPHARIYHSALAQDGSIWYATLEHIYRVDQDKEKVEVKIQKQLEGYSFRHIAFVGQYLVGITQDNRLLIVNKFAATPIVDTIKGQNCIWDRAYPVDGKHLLLGTNNQYRILTTFASSGAPKYNVSTVEDPMVPLDVESVCCDSNSCYFFKSGSIFRFDLKSLFAKPASPSVFYNYIKTSKHTYAVDSQVAIGYKESKNALISVTCVSFSGKDVFYEFAIYKDWEPHWQSMQGPELNLVNIGSGTYKISVRAKTLSSDYSVPATFILQIDTPWWGTWWFACILIAALVSITIVLVRYRLNVLLKRKEKEHQTEIKFMRSEYKALNALMNPHFIFNTINNLQTLFNGEDRKRANKYLRIFSDLVRQNMHNVSRDLISLQKEMDLVANYLMLEKLRFEQLNYTISIDSDLDLADIMVPPLIIQPLVENAIKHGILPLKSDDGCVLISISEMDSKVTIEIRDNGVGIKPLTSVINNDTIHKSFALSNLKERISKLRTIQNSDIVFDMYEAIDETPHRRRWTVVSVSLDIP